MHVDLHVCAPPSPFWVTAGAPASNTKKVLSQLCCHCCLLLVLLLCFFTSGIIDSADRQQVHQLLDRGQYWLWEQLESENKTGHQITRRVGDFHTEVAGLAINDLFLAIKSRLRGEFLAGFLKDAANIILNTEPAREVEEPRSAAGASSSSSSSSTSSSSSGDGESAPSGTQP